MIEQFPVEGVKVCEVDSARRVENPSYIASSWQVSSEAFSMQVEGVGSFYASGGTVAEYSVIPGADSGWVRLYLNGHVAIALLHQRGVMSFHASSFVHSGIGVMIIGESGAGKSSLTASFSLKGAGFLTDDVTPVLFRDNYQVILPLHESIRIRKNTADQLNVNGSLLSDAEKGTGKHYVSVGKSGETNARLGVILTIEVGDVLRPTFDEPSPAEKFELLRGEICMSEMLAGMPETEVAYLGQLVQIIEKVRFVRIIRPSDIRIADLHDSVEQYLNSSLRQQRKI